MTLPLLIDSSPETLPDDLEYLFDPSISLPPEHTLIPHGLGAFLPPATIATVALISGLVFASGVFRDEASAMKWIYGVLAALCLLASLRPAHRALFALRGRVALATEQWRRGLHLLPDALLLWNGQTVTMVPREAALKVHFAARSEGATYRRYTVLEVRRGDGKSATLELPPIPPPNLGEEGAAGSLFAALSAWRESGCFEPPMDPATPPPELVRPWVSNIVLGHLVLAGVSACALVVLTGVAQLLGRSPGALLGLLLGVPMFLGFPAILEQLAGSRLAREPESGRPLGWGYMMLLGLAALFVVAVGAEATGKLWWQLRATEQNVTTLAKIKSSAGTPTFHRWPEELRPIDEPIGYHVHRMFLGDASWVESSFYVVPLAHDANPAVSCVWYGLETSEGGRSSASVRRLLEDRSPWLVEVAGLKTSGYQDAVDNALRGIDSNLPCRPLVLEGSLSRPEAILGSTRRLGILHGLAHGLPLLALAAWAAWRLDRRRPGVILSR